jgi:hypothetical protein
MPTHTAQGDTEGHGDEDNCNRVSVVTQWPKQTPRDMIEELGQRILRLFNIQLDA